jgi:hypothetical protein
MGFWNQSQRDYLLPGTSPINSPTRRILESFWVVQVIEVAVKEQNKELTAGPCGVDVTHLHVSARRIVFSNSRLASNQLDLGPIHNNISST